MCAPTNLPRRRPLRPPFTLARERFRFRSASIRPLPPAADRPKCGFSCPTIRGPAGDPTPGSSPSRATSGSAAHDGEYWFAIRTLERNQPQPEGPFEPQLRVIVDTLTPRLDLSAAARRKRRDCRPLASPRHGPQARLVPARVPGERKGRLAPAGDRCRTAALRTVHPVGRSHLVAAHDRRFGAGAASHGVGRGRQLGGQPGADQSDRRCACNGRPAPRADGRRPRRRTNGRGNGSRAGPMAGRTFARRNGRECAGGQRNGARIVRRPVPLCSGTAAPRLDGRPSNGQTPAQTVSRSRPGQPTGGGDWSLLPIGERPRMINERTFELDYEVEAVGSSGVAKVELWGTRDGGRHWSSFGVDTDNRSPAVVTVEGEGVYGFRVVIHSGNGLSGARPARANCRRFGSAST